MKIVVMFYYYWVCSDITECFEESNFILLICSFILVCNLFDWLTYVASQILQLILYTTWFFRNGSVISLFILINLFRLLILSPKVVISFVTSWRLHDSFFSWRKSVFLSNANNGVNRMEDRILIFDYYKWLDINKGK